MKDSWLEIVNIEKLVDFSRKLIYHNFDNQTKSMTDTEFFESVKNLPQEQDEEINRLLPMKECKLIMQSYIKKKRHKKTKQVIYIIKESHYDEVLSEFNQRMISNIVSSLVSKGALEMAFDDEKNDFVFWVKKDTEDNLEEEESEE